MYYIELCIIYIYMNIMYYIVQPRHLFLPVSPARQGNSSTLLAVTA
jgi:hypothetical protein